MDQLNCTLLMDIVTADAYRALAPHMSTFSLNEPREISDNLAHPKPVVMTTAHFIHDTSNQGDMSRMAKMMELLELA